MQVKAAIEQKLTAALAPLRLSVIDDSQRHAGHAGARPEGETHFNVEIVAARFAGWVFPLPMASMVMLLARRF